MGQKATKHKDADGEPSPSPRKSPKRSKHRGRRSSKEHTPSHSEKSSSGDPGGGRPYSDIEKPISPVSKKSLQTIPKHESPRISMDYDQKENIPDQTLSRTPPKMNGNEKMEVCTPEKLIDSSILNHFPQATSTPAPNGIISSGQSNGHAFDSDQDQTDQSDDEAFTPSEQQFPGNSPSLSTASLASRSTTNSWRRAQSDVKIKMASHSFTRQFKSVPGKRHNTDLVGIELLNELDYAWMGTYNQRSLLVRTLYDSTLENKIDSVKFFTKDLPETSHYDCDSSLQGLTIEDFYESINSSLETFEHSEITEENWKEIVHCIKLLDLKCAKELWSSKKSLKTDKDVKEAFGKLSTEQKEYVSAFVTTMATDMENGQAKMWIHELVRILLTCLQSDNSKPNVKGFVPCLHDTTSTLVETIFGDLESIFTQKQYDAPYIRAPSGGPSNSSSLLSLSSLNLESAKSAPDGTGDSTDTKHTTVSDYCVALPDFPGVLLLVVELVPGYQELRAYGQITQKMLSKLFFQDVVFGLVVSPRSFQLFVIIKGEGNLHFVDTHCVSIIKLKNKVRMLDVKRLNTMCTFIYQVIKWAWKTKCLLTTASRCEGEGDHKNSR
ncbi:uncharacterized protein LOC134715607 isoform X2 [Mytilus trossulus]|uniref:uncharacterized protein LOC134715607 isoform X2 n=1 Tax=Mytilus trossulus TaxID=6551 RepID=UPI0030070653